MTARAFWAVAPGVGEIRTAALPALADGLCVKTLFSGVSRGTERLVFHGRVPPSEHDRMRAPLQEGAFGFPVKYGYCAVGIVEAGPAARLGECVFCLAPHQDRFVAPAALCATLPAGLPPRRAVLAANMETALNVLWDARPLLGERALVVGAGVVGLLVARLLTRLPGVAVTLTDTDAGRAALAGTARFVAPDAVGDDHELVVHASGHPDGLATALAACVFEGRIIEASWFGDRPVTLPLGAGFHARRLSIAASQVGSVAGPMRGRRTHAERLAMALALLRDDPWCDGLLGADTPFEALPARFAALLTGAAPCPVVAYGPDSLVDKT